MRELFVPVYAVPSEGGTYYEISKYPLVNYSEAVAVGEFYDGEIGNLVGIFKLVQVDNDGKEITKG